LAFGASFISSWIRIRIRNADPGDKSNADPYGSGSETLPQTKKKQKANLGKELIYLGDLDMMMLRRLTRRNALQENAIVRYQFFEEDGIL
jgi:hypothetical protein